jgi:hypothetical protein
MIAVSAPLSLSTSPGLPTEINGQPYSGNINALGGVGPYAWYLGASTSGTPITGTTLATGISIGNGLYLYLTGSGGSGTMNIGGQASSSSPVNFTVTVEDSLNNSATQSYTISAQSAFAVSGTINYSGPYTGWVYVALAPNCSNCNNQPTYGTAVDWTSAVATAGNGLNFTIQGVPSGTYTVEAFLDNVGQGAMNYSNPTGTTSSFSVPGSGANGAATAPTVTLTAPTDTDTQIASLTPSSPSVMGAYAFDSASSLGGVMMNVSPMTVTVNSNSMEVPASYSVEWSTSDSFPAASCVTSTNNATSATNCQTFPASGANGGQPFILNNLTAGDSYYFMVWGTSADGTATSNTAVTASATAIPAYSTACASGTYEVSGSVALPSLTVTGPLYAGVYNQVTNTAYVVAVPQNYVNSGSTTTPFSVCAPPGSYYMPVAILDQQDDGDMGWGAISNTNGASPTVLAVSGPTSGVEIDLTPYAGNAYGYVQTIVNESLDSSGNVSGGPNYTVSINVLPEVQLPVAVEITSETPATNGGSVDITTPIDLASESFQTSSPGNFRFWTSTNNNLAPVKGDKYAVNVTYSGTSVSADNLTPAATAVLDGVNGPSAFATGLLPNTGSTPSVANMPNFTWTDPANAGNYVYSFSLSSNSNCVFCNNAIWELPSQHGASGFNDSITSINWDVDPLASGDLPTNAGCSANNEPALCGNSTFAWGIQAQDQYENEAQVTVNFTTTSTGGTLDLPPEPLGTALVGTAYENSFSVGGTDNSGTNSPLTWSCTAGCSSTSTIPNSGSTVEIGSSGLYLTNNGGNTLTILGTPATSDAGTYNFTIQVTDSAIPPNTVSQSYSITVADPASASSTANNSLLSGYYVCKSDSYSDSTNHRYATLFNFSANAANPGVLSGGVWDMNGIDLSAGEYSGTVAGSYNVGADGNGMATITWTTTAVGGTTLGTPLTSTSDFAIAVNGSGSEIRFVADDAESAGSSTHSSGLCYQADETKWANSTIGGTSGNSFAFGGEGESTGGVPDANVGRMTYGTYSSGSNGGNITSGYMDGGGAGDSETDDWAGSFTGSYTGIDSYGRFNQTLSLGSGSANDVVYIIDASRFFWLQTNAGTTSGFLAGDVREQTSNMPSSASALGSFVNYMQEWYYSTTSTSYHSKIMQFTTSGGTSTLNVNYRNDNGTYKGCASPSSCGNASLSLTFDGGNAGRAYFPGSPTPSSPGTGDGVYFYFYDTNSAFTLELNAGNENLGYGWMENQSQTTFSNAALAGQYVIGLMARPSFKYAASVGEATLDSAGNVAVGNSKGGENAFFFDQPSAASVSWDSQTYGAFEMGDPVDNSCVVISATKFVCTKQANNNPQIGIFGQ